jgi:hypothetical protein
LLRTEKPKLAVISPTTSYLEGVTAPGVEAPVTSPLKATTHFPPIADRHELSLFTAHHLAHESMYRPIIMAPKDVGIFKLEGVYVSWVGLLVESDNSYLLL